MSSFRLIAGFLISFKSADWILDIGFLKTFAIYSGIMLLFSLMLPIVYRYGKRMRLWSAGQFESASPDKTADSDNDDARSINSIEMSKPWAQHTSL